MCPICKKDNINVSCIALERLSETQQKASRLASICSSCNGCLETLETFASEEHLENKSQKQQLFGTPRECPRRGVGRLSNPIASCVCIDCPVTYARHETREHAIEATELCRSLDIL